MTWQIEHTITWDPAADAATQTVDALKYFFDTFLPTKGWTTSLRSGDTIASTRRIVQRNFTDIFTNTAQKHYLWFNFPNASITQYEDATYTTTPGDLGTDTTNFSSAVWHDAGQTWGQKNFKFWGSTENNKSFMVTRWDNILAWDPGINWPLFQPNDTLANNEAPNIDMWQSNLFIPMNESSSNTGYFKAVNLPTNTNTGTGENNIYAGVGLDTNNKGADGGMWDKVEFRIHQTSGWHVIWDQADVKTYMYGTNTSNIVTDSFMPVQVNSGNYWLFTKGNLGVTQMCFDLGPTLPSFD